MTWNFRLVKHVGPPPKKVWYGVHEVFYNEKGRAFTMTEDPVDITGETPKETRLYLEMIRRDLRRLLILDLPRTRWAKPPWNPSDKGSKTLKDLWSKNTSAAISSVSKDVAETVRKVRLPARKRRAITTPKH